MQLIKKTLGAVILIFGGNLIAQNTSTEVSPQDTVKAKLGQIEIDILSSYYDQDGVHSPVTGG
ncbi:MAG: hypothetical protein GW818_06985, partial [Flavobacteriales bacterium]|nr:hypothetical protein [Flavobacteriales bacterium]